jgi:hypothetical protein
VFCSLDMEVAALSPIDPWVAVSLPRVDPSGWDAKTARLGLAQVRRLQGELDAAKALLVVVVSAEAGRDLKATVVRDLGVSQAEAARIVKTANVWNDMNVSRRVLRRVSTVPIMCNDSQN